MREAHQGSPPKTRDLERTGVIKKIKFILTKLTASLSVGYHHSGQNYTAQRCHKVCHLKTHTHSKVMSVCESQRVRLPVVLTDRTTHRHLQHHVRDGEIATSCSLSVSVSFQYIKSPWRGLYSVLCLFFSTCQSAFFLSFTSLTIVILVAAYILPLSSASPSLLLSIWLCSSV